MAERAYGLLAEFDSPEKLLDAARDAREEGYRRLDAFTPYPVDGLASVLQIPRPKVSLIGLIGGFTGAAFAFGMQCYTNYDFPINVGGRPIYAFTAFSVVVFELTVLFSALSMIIAMLYLNGLPRLSYPVFSAPRFHLASRNRFFLCIAGDDAKFDDKATSAFLKRIGALSVELVPS